MASRVVRNVVLRVVWLCLSLYPFHYHVYGVALLFFGKFASAWYAVPFLEATAAAACRGMLRDEDRMAAHGCLPAVVRRAGGCQPSAYEVGGVAVYGGPSFFLYVQDVAGFQTEAASEG